MVQAGQWGLLSHVDLLHLQPRLVHGVPVALGAPGGLAVHLSLADQRPLALPSHRVVQRGLLTLWNPWLQALPWIQATLLVLVHLALQGDLFLLLLPVILSFPCPQGHLSLLAFLLGL